MHACMGSLHFQSVKGTKRLSWKDPNRLFLHKGISPSVVMRMAEAKPSRQGTISAENMAQRARSRQTLNK